MNEQTLAPGFWDDSAKAQDVLKQKSRIDNKIKEYETLEARIHDLDELAHLADEMEEEDEADEIIASFGQLKKDVESFRLATLLNGKYDANDAIVTIHAGAGGVEAMDWAEMLLRMYTRWAEKKRYNVSMADLQDDTEAGIKSATFFVDGENAYGYLKHEQGVHRLVRISPFNAAGKRQTSFASVEIMPKIEEDLSVEINPEDIRIDTYRSSGAGGQHVNKTDSAIRITHLPTNIVVTCQNERSQHQNKEVAMRILVSKLVAEGPEGRLFADRLGVADPLLCVPALYDGEGSPDERRGGECPGRDGRRSGSADQCGTEGAVIGAFFRSRRMTENVC